MVGKTVAEIFAEHSEENAQQRWEESIAVFPTRIMGTRRATLRKVHELLMEGYNMESVGAKLNRGRGWVQRCKTQINDLRCRWKLPRLSNEELKVLLAEHWTDALPSTLVSRLRYHRPNLLDKETARAFIQKHGTESADMLGYGIAEGMLEILCEVLEIPSPYLKEPKRVLHERTLQKYAKALREHGYTVTKDATIKDVQEV